MLGGPDGDDPDDIFMDFVRRANAEWVASVEAALSETDVAPPIDPDRTDRIVLLTTPKPRHDEITVRERVIDVEVRSAKAPKKTRSIARATEDAPIDAAVTQRREAARVVPDVASVRPPPIPAAEGSEDGQMPSGELDRKLADMDVLVRYGHAAQVETELATLRLRYPDDLLLLRRIAELLVRHDLRAPALEALFALATALFERRNVEGMRQALELVRVLEPRSVRAARLLALLDQRPSDGRR